MVPSWGSAGTHRATRHCIFNSSLLSSSRNKSCSRLSSWTDQGKRTGQWSFGNSKCQSLWSKGLEIKLAVTSGQDTKITEVSALLIHSGKQIEEQSLENILHEQGKDTLPPLPLLAQTQFLRMGLKKKSVWGTHMKHFSTCLFSGFPLVFNQGRSQTRINEIDNDKNFHCCKP